MSLELMGMLKELQRRVKILENREQRMITPLGGIAIKVVALEDLYEGEVVAIKVSGGADGKVWKAPIDSDMPVGVVYQDALADANCWIVVSGIGYVLPTAGVTAALWERYLLLRFHCGQGGPGHNRSSDNYPCP